MLIDESRHTVVCCLAMLELMFMLHSSVRLQGFDTVLVRISAHRHVIASFGVTLRDFKTVLVRQFSDYRHVIAHVASTRVSSPPGTGSIKSTKVYGARLYKRQPIQSGSPGVDRLRSLQDCQLSSRYVCHASGGRKTEREPCRAKQRSGIWRERGERDGGTVSATSVLFT
ncbi:uncharacterized protein LOC122533756 [Frieseomelitta varia]|uniref:uncharacterized protein LOC122533756 n=1 Tax=Frieseomelitta varia TaxID=561572 RepID=UPI001CB69526|nr:uncharacterized protein LOC122533756 [Frieseomelitta varia]